MSMSVSDPNTANLHDFLQAVPLHPPKSTKMVLFAYFTDAEGLRFDGEVVIRFRCSTCGKINRRSLALSIVPGINPTLRFMDNPDRCIHCDAPLAALTIQGSAVGTQADVIAEKVSSFAVRVDNEAEYGPE